jgi:hypothetical protein
MNKYLYLLCVCCLLFLTAAKAETDDAWKVVNDQYQFPSLYSNSFIDSLLAVRKVSLGQNLRTITSRPYTQGEKLVFDVSWGPINAGFAILETVPDAARGVFTLSGRGATNGFFNSFYKVRDIINAPIDKNGMYPIFFEQHLREGNYKADRWELFDQTNKTVYTYKKSADSVPVPAFVQNYFSMIYYVRSQQFSVGDSLAFDCFVDTKPYRLVLFCPQKSTIKLDCGTFNCLLIKPVLVGSGRVFTKKDELLLWVTDDEYRMPVMVKAKIQVGSITAKLRWFERK